MILSKQKCCLWSTGVSTESQNLTSVLHLRQDILATRNMLRVDVGLAQSYLKLLISSWKTYMCNLMAWLCEVFTFLMENIYVQFDGMVYQ